eukprot:scaffold28117_cov64-Phaeocystis_antarctica.AAC.9
MAVSRRWLTAGDTSEWRTATSSRPSAAAVRLSEVTRSCSRCRSAAHAAEAQSCACGADGAPSNGSHAVKSPRAVGSRHRATELDMPAGVSAGCSACAPASSAAATSAPTKASCHPKPCVRTRACSPASVAAAGSAEDSGRAGCAGRGGCAGSALAVTSSPFVTSDNILSWRFSGSSATKRLSSISHGWRGDSGLASRRSLPRARERFAKFWGENERAIARVYSDS